MYHDSDGAAPRDLLAGLAHHLSQIAAQLPDNTGPAPVQAAHLDPEAHAQHIRDIIGQALQTQLQPGESLPVSLRVYPTFADAGRATSDGLVQPGSVLYIPPDGSAWVALPGEEFHWHGDILDTPELRQYAGAARVAQALAEHGPMRSAAASGPASAARLTAMAFPDSFHTVTARQGGQPAGVASAGRGLAGFLRAARASLG
jgi:hypothetical protein